MKHYITYLNEILITSIFVLMMYLVIKITDEKSSTIKQ